MRRILWLLTSLAVLWAVALPTQTAQAGSYSYTPTTSGMLARCPGCSGVYVLSPSHTIGRSSSTSFANIWMTYATFTVPAGVTYSSASLQFAGTSLSSPNSLFAFLHSGPVTADQATYDAFRFAPTVATGAAVVGPVEMTLPASAIESMNTLSAAGGGQLTIGVRGVSGQVSAYQVENLLLTGSTVVVPTVTSVSPTAGGAGSPVTLTGAGFTGASSVTFGGAPATSFSVNSDMEITATTPAGAGTVDVQVATAAGASDVSGAGDNFTYVAAPTVTSVSPAIREIGGAVVITGTGFSSGVTGVTFGGVAATYSIAGATSITATVPAGTGTVNVQVTGVGGASDTSGTGDDFTYRGAPVVTSISPGWGDPVGGVLVTITGENFHGVSEVWFGATKADVVIPLGPTTVRAPAPAGSGRVDIKVVTPAGESDTSGTGDDFAYLVTPATPVITAPGVPTPRYNTATPTLGGTAEAGVTVNIDLSGPTPTTTVTADGSGAWSYTPPALADGNYGLTVSATNLAGTSGLTSRTFVIDTTAPVAPVISAPIDGATLDDAMPTVTGTAEPNATVTVLVDGSPVGAATASGAGAWSLTPSSGLAEGAHAVVATATDAATNVSPASSTVNITIDTTPPALNIGDVSIAEGGGAAAVTVTLDKPARAGGVTFDIATADGTATVAQADYTVLSLTGWTIPAGVTTAQFDITLGGDADFEPDETFFVNVANVVGATVVDGQGVVTILNDDVQPAPTVADVSGVAVPYGGGGTAIDLSGSISGVHASITVATGPAHGTVSVAGDVVIYTSTAGYYGADSFTYTASGPGGTSAPATVSLTVATPGAPTVADVSGVSVPYNGSGTAIDLSGSISGVHTGVTVAVGPAHGTASVAGDVITYTPAAGYYGADSFSYTAAGPGGTSAPATVSLTVATPGAPTVANVSGVAVPYGGSGTAIDLSGSITGTHSSIAVVSAPVHGSVSVSGDVVTYTTAGGYFGADSFRYTATGPGGTSAPATVSLTVAAPAAPVAADMSGVAAPYNGSGTAIDLSGSITGVHGSIAIATAPTHGTVSVIGDVVTYTPSAGYFGADSFTWTATGPGGTSAPATVSLTVATPAAPTAADATADIAFDSPGHAIELQPAGVYSSVSAATPPAHGVVTISGATATYTPTAGYHGPDSFTWTATGPGGVSAPGTVRVTVAAPPPPVVTSPPPVTTPPDPDGSGEVEIDLAGLTSGAVDSFRIVTAPQHGVAVIETVSETAGPAARPASSGPAAVPRQVLRYTAAAGFMGTDRLAIVAVGPGGQSAPVEFAVQVPGRAPDLSGSVASNASITFSPTAGLTGGPFEAVRIITAPAYGAAAIEGLDILFTPGLENGGPTSLAYVIDLPFGASAAGRINIVSHLAPAVASLRAETSAGVPVTVRISDDAQGGPFTGAVIDGQSPAEAGEARIHATGEGASRAYDLTFTPAGIFSGEVQIAFTLSNAVASGSGVLTITVEPRPDPAADPEVRGIATSQLSGARRFADVQISNVQRRLESLHDGVNEGRNGLSFNLAGGVADDPRAALARQMGRQPDPHADGADRDREFLGLSVWNGADTAQTSVGVPDTGRAEMAPVGQAGKASSVGVWTAGSVDWGRQDADGQRDYRFTTQGVTVGLDVRASDRLVVGVGVGYGADRTRIGDSGSVSEANSLTGAVYASYLPGGDYYLDGLAGYGDLDFTSRRWAQGFGSFAGGFADGERSGSVRFGSVAFGRNQRSKTELLRFYARMDVRSMRLDAFTEQGAGIASLAWSEIEQESLTASLGWYWSRSLALSRDLIFTPSLRLEWGHEFEETGDQGVRYADWAASPLYLAPLDGWSRDSLRLNLGGEWEFRVLMISLGYRGSYGGSSQSHGLDLGARWSW